MKSQNTDLRRVVGAGLILASVGVFCFYNYTFAVDFPFMDDFMLVLFVHEYTTYGFDFLDFINKLFQSANSHKMVIPRLMALVDYIFTGDLNFRTYQLIVTINILATIGLIYHHFRKSGLSIFHFVPFVLLLLHPQYYDITLFGLNGIQHTSVLLFTVLGLHFLDKDKAYSLPVALAFCFLSTFSHGNGYFAFCGVVFYLLATRKYKNLLFTFLFMGIILAMFLYKTNDSGMAKYPESITLFLGSFFAFIGATIAQSANYGNQLAIATGFCIVVFVGGLCLQTLLKTNNKKDETEKQLMFWLSFFAFILGTSLIITFLRSWSGLLIASRFQIYAALSIGVAYIILLIKFKMFRNPKFVSIVIFCSAIINIHSYYYFSDVVLGRKTQFIADIYNWKNNRTMFSVGKNFLDNSDYFFTPAYENKLVLAQNPIVSEQEMSLFFDDTFGPVLSIETDLKIVKNGDYSNSVFPQSFIISNDLTPGYLPFSGMRFLILQNIITEQKLLISAVPLKSTQLQVLSGSNYYKSGFYCNVREGDISEGEYQIAMMDIAGNEEKKFYKSENQYFYVSPSGEMEVMAIQSENITEQYQE